MAIKLYKPVNEGIQCLLCPHFCILKENRVGRCKSRKVFNGNREMVRLRATIFALNLIRKELVDAQNYY